MGKTHKKIWMGSGAVVLVAAAAIHMSPLYLMVVNSFKNRAELFESALALPERLDFQFYVEAMERMEFLNAFYNSMIITISAVLLIIVTSSMTAWVLVRSDSKWSHAIFLTFVATMLIPFQTIMMPLMQVTGVVHNLFGIQMLNSRAGLVFMYIGFGAAMSVFLFHGFIKSIPVSLEEAASIDGATKFGIFWRIVFPMLKPITTTVVILNVIWIWNDFLLPSLVLTSRSLRTIPLSTASFFGVFTIQWNLAMAGLTLTIIPVIIFYTLVQKAIIKGVSEGAVK